MADLTPHAFVLKSYANSGLPWWKAIAELVDNSINAECNRVVISVANRILSISDDGVGAKDILALFRLGDDQHKRGNAMYGIGAKDAWLSCADSMQVSTVHKGTCRSLSVNINELIANNWQSPDPAVEETGGPSGTTISLPIRKERQIPSSDVYSTLSWVFSPAIKSGKQILVVSGKKREALRPVEMPARDDIVVSEFDIDGKKVIIDIGILPDGKSIERGPFWLIHKHRILEGTSLGASSKYSVRRMAGTITLGDGWKIGKNKDCLTDNADRLAEAIFVRIEGILSKAATLSESIESELLRTELQELINSALSSANKKGRGKRKPKSSSTGAVNPTGTGSKHRRSIAVHRDGDVVEDDSPAKKICGFHFDWCTMDHNSIGKFDSTGNRVYLNESNAFISALKADNNRKAILCCVMSLIADDDCRRDDNGRRLLKFAYKDFAEAIGKLLNERQDKEQSDAKAV